MANENLTADILALKLMMGFVIDKIDAGSKPSPDEPGRLRPLLQADIDVSEVSLLHSPASDAFAQRVRDSLAFMLHCGQKP